MYILQHENLKSVYAEPPTRRNNSFVNYVCILHLIVEYLLCHAVNSSPFHQ